MHTTTRPESPKRAILAGPYHWNQFNLLHRERHKHNSSKSLRCAWFV